MRREFDARVGWRARDGRALVLLLAVVAIGFPASAQDARGKGAAPVKVGVARFEDDAQGGSFSEVGTLLAARLRSAPLDVVDPNLVGAEPAPAEMANWILGLGLDAVVTGNVVRLGERTSIHARLRGPDGQVLETFVEEVAGAESLVAGVDRLGGHLLGGLERATGAVLLPAEAAEDAKGGEQNSLRIGGEQPLQVESEELEVIPGESGGRRIVFTKAVQAEQGRMRLQTDRLEAIYPPGSNDPERFVATGRVRMSEQRPDGERSLQCDRATFFQAEERLICTGNAELREGADRVRGKEIEILLREDVVKVRGGAVLNLSARSEGE